MIRKNKVYKQLTTMMLSVALMLPSCVSMPRKVLAQTNDVTTASVTTQEEFTKALENESVDVIELKNIITLSRSEDSKDNAFVINRSVTITGGENNSGGLELERSGIVLGGNVTFEHMSFSFISPVRNAIFANGYSLTVDNVSSVGTYAIDLFCGGITDYNGSNLSEIPSTGSDGIITIKGTNTIGTNIYVGSLSDVGDGKDDIPNVYSGNATIVLEKDASGFSNIYAHGARENRSGGYYNDWLASANLYKVSGDVNVCLNTVANITVDGETGSQKNASFIYKDEGKGYLCEPILNNVDSIKLIPSDDDTKANLKPSVTQSDFSAISVPANTRLSFVNMGDEISASAFEGGGEIIFSGVSQKLTLDNASGTTKVAVGDVSYEGTNSTGTVYEDWNCISVTNAKSEYEFLLLPDFNDSKMFLDENGEGNWITKSEKSSVSIRDITITEVINEIEGVYSVYVPIEVTYSTEDESNYLGDIPMTVTVNGIEMYVNKTYLGYDYSTGTTNSDIMMWFDFDEDGKEILYIENYDYDYPIPIGRYEISIAIPDTYMEDGQEEIINFVLTVSCNEHADEDVDGKCDVCESSINGVVLKGSSITLSGTIGMNFYFEFDNQLKETIWEDETAMVRFSLADGRIIDIPVNEGVEDANATEGEILYKYCCDLYAKQMADNVKVQFIMNDKVLAEYEHSVANYAKVIIANEEGNYSQETINLVKAMLNYGANAQMYFDYNEGNLANCIKDNNDNELISEDEKDVSNITTEVFEPYKVSETVIEGIGKFVSSNLVLESETTLKIYFEPETLDVTLDKLTFKVGENEMTATKYDDYFMIAITNIKANELDTDFEIIVSNGTITDTFTCSVFSYCYSVLNDTTDTFSDELKNTVKALYQYNRAADSYVNRL